MTLDLKMIFRYDCKRKQRKKFKTFVHQSIQVRVKRQPTEWESIFANHIFDKE